MKEEGKTVAVWLPKGVLDRLPELMSKKHIATTSRLIRTVLEDEISKLPPKGETLPLGGSS